MAVKKDAPNPVPTFEDLVTKPRRVKTITVDLPGPDGEERQFDLKFQALGSEEYDNLVAAHPPTAKQKKEGRVYNTDTFTPALIAKSLKEPQLTPEQAQELLDSDSWSTGELTTLINEVLSLNLQGLSIPFGDSDSE